MHILSFSEQQIEDMLRRLENGDISEDDLESDGEDIPYYPPLGALSAELKDDEDSGKEANEGS